MIKKPNWLATIKVYISCSLYSNLKKADPLLRWLWSPEIPDTQKNSADLSFPKYKIEAFFVELLEQKQTKLWKQHPRALLLFNRTIKKEGHTLLSRQGRVPSYCGEIFSEGALLGTLGIWSVLNVPFVDFFKNVSQFLQIQDLGQSKSKIAFSQKDTYLVFLSLFPSVLLSC